jgi:hypothetical protein
MNPSDPTLEEARFWARVDKSGECWLWTGPRDKDGYGKANVRRRALRAHRVSWTMANGAIPEGLIVCHRCDTPACVRPDHLWLGTQLDNVRDMTAKGRRASGPRPAHRKGGLPGERNPRATFTAEEVLDIRKRADGGETLASIRRAYGVSKNAVYSVARRITWRHL